MCMTGTKEASAVAIHVVIVSDAASSGGFTSVVRSSSRICQVVSTAEKEGFGDDTHIQAEITFYVFLFVCFLNYFDLDH